MTNQTGTAVALRGQTDVVPAGYEPLELQPPGRLPTKDEYSMMMMIASMAVEGANKAIKADDRAIPANIKTPEQAMTVMLAGFELGMPPFTALRRVFIVKGRTELETQALMGLVRAGDRTARFVFHEYTSDVVDVELFRAGESMIRCAYTRKDAQLSGQLKEKWYRKKDFNADGQPYFMVPPTQELEPGDKLGPVVARSNPPVHYVLEMAGSAWTSYTRDMLAYNAVKRCCRLGAPELTNQIGGLAPRGELEPPPYRVAIEERARGDEPGALTSHLHRALVEGKVTPAEMTRETVTDDEDRAQVEDDEAQDRAAFDAQVERHAAEIDGDSPADPKDIETINRLLKDCKDTWPSKDYGTLWRDLLAAIQPTKAKLEPQQFTARQAHECLAMIRSRRGEPPATPDVQTSAIEPPNEEPAAEYGPEDEEPLQAELLPGEEAE